MGVESKWPARWFAKLIGKLHAGAGGQHQSTGDGVMHIGQATGPVTTVHQVTQHFYAAPTQAGPPIQAAPKSPQQLPTKAEQSQVLALMDQLPDRIPVLNFMERSFDTRMVIRLDSIQLHRLKCYVEVILNKEKQ